MDREAALPINIRRTLKLKDDDKVAFIKKDGLFILTSPTVLAFENVLNVSK